MAKSLKYIHISSLKQLLDHDLEQKKCEDRYHRGCLDKKKYSDWKEDGQNYLVTTPTESHLPYFLF